jgi:very-short-patch-repair endonuclease
MARVPNIVVGQTVHSEKVVRSKQLRSDMTPSEKTLWLCLRANRLQGLKFRRQQIIDGFIVDFYCHADALIVEADGPIHDLKKTADLERERVLVGRGFLLLRFTNHEIESNLKAVLDKIASTGNERNTK